MYSCRQTPPVSNKPTTQYSLYKNIFMGLSLFFSAVPLSSAAILTSPLYGGGGGNAFTDTLTANQQLTGITIRSGCWVDAIQSITTTGTLPSHGGIGGNLASVTWPANEYLVRIYGMSGWQNFVDKISFVTNTGRVLGPYGNPADCPGISGSATSWPLFDFTVPAGGRITGFTGRSGSYVDAIGVVYDNNPDLITNGSFEQSTTGWTGFGDVVEVNLATVYGVTGATGTKVAELDAYTVGPGTGFFQMVPTLLGQSYSLSVNVAARGSSSTVLASNSVEVWWKNQYIATIDPASTAFATYTFNVTGSGGSDRLEFREQAGDDDSLGGIIDNVRLLKNTTAPTASDISVTIAQPMPALTATALSEIPVTLTNIGAQIIAAPITVSLPLPAGIDAPLKFARNADAWVCLKQVSTLACTYTKPLAIGATTTVRLPVVPLAATLGTVPKPFVAQVTAVASEVNLRNNRSPVMIPSAAVKTLALSSYVDPSNNYSLPLLNPTIIPKYAMPLPNALASFFQHTPNTTLVPGTNSYNLDIKQVKAHILPPGFPATDVFAYGDPARPDTFTYPAHSIVANSNALGLNTSALGRPVKIKFNDTRTNITHLLPVDHSIHGAMAGEPDIRSVAHIHGTKNVNQISDGYPEGWISPNGKTGGQFSVTSPTVGYNPNPFDQPNNQESTLLWYHDHTLGMTRLNVYAGLAGLYVLRDSNEQAMINNNSLPGNAYEIPLVLQDRMFHADGSLAYPDKNPAVATAPAISMIPEFYGNVMVVNGVAWPFLEVEPRRYRFRMLNGSSSRFYTLTLSNNASIQVIGTEGGFLAAPAPVTSLTIAPGERYDLVIDFSGVTGQTITLKNSAASPFPGGATVAPGLDDQIMQFRVNQPLSATPNNPLPTSLRPGGVPVLTPTVLTPRQVLLAESTDNNGRILPILGTVANGLLGWMDTVTETPLAGSVETWEIFNDTVDGHPIHLHGGHFQVVNRQPFTAIVGLNHALTNIAFPSAAVLPGAQEQTWKDTVISYPGQVTRIKVKFENAGLFVWHCHILEHEDHDMMRPMLVK
ncbi:MAG: multicopper oxidase domain-containing protein [Methylococcaceae bacterium]